MYQKLKTFLAAPAPFSRYTAPLMWNDPYIAQKMLSLHLNPNHDIASRKPETIDNILDWMERHTSLKGRIVLDLGCGPGLYAQKMAERGANVTGMDISSVSIEYARMMAMKTDRQIEFIENNYLSEHAFPPSDVVTLIYGDICALSPAQRAQLYRKVKAALRPGGVFILDAFTADMYATYEPLSLVEPNLMDNFWMGTEYIGFQKRILYPSSLLVLDHYWIVSEGRELEIFNWLEHFTPDKLSAELIAAGFRMKTLMDLPSAFMVMASA